MRKIFVTALLIVFAAGCEPAFAEDQVRQNPYQPQRYEQYNSAGQYKGQIRENRFQAGRYDRYNADGQATDTVRQNRFQQDRYDVYDNAE